MAPQRHHAPKEKTAQRPKTKLGIEERIPTMPCVFNKNFRITRTTREKQAYRSSANYVAPHKPICPRCSSRLLRLYDHYTRHFLDINEQGGKREIKLTAKRFKCQNCTHLFREPIENLRPWQRSSQRYRKAIAHEYKKNVNNKTIAKEFQVSESTVERIIHEQYTSLIKEILNYPCPQILGIDEHSIHKKRKFATTICDLKNHRIYDVIEGKSKAEIQSVLMKYPGREKVKMVCIDLSSSYRSLVRHCFPNAKIVADRFHVIKLVGYHFMEFCKQAQESVKWNRTLIYPLRKKASNLTPREKINLNTFFSKNPAIESAYHFKEELTDLLRNKSQNHTNCLKHIKHLKEMMSRMKNNAPAEFGRLAKTMSNWFEPIIRMWRFTKNNGITEGFHRKMKLIQRRAYGYRNFENYRLRVLVECSGGRI